MSNSASPFRSPLALLLFFGVTILGVAGDLWTKQVAFEKLTVGVEFHADPSLPEGRAEAIASGPDHIFIKDWIHFHATTNQGAVFGLGRGKKWLFVIVSLFAIVVLTSLFSKSNGRRFYQLMLGMLLGGVLGNMYDRIRFGYVRDMIYALPDWKNPLRGMFPSWQTVFPWIFNIADMLLCVGVFLMIVYSFVQKPETEAKPETQPTE